MRKKRSFLASVRKEAGYNHIEEAAKILKMSGGHLSNIENGLRAVSKENAEKIAALYGKEIDQIFLPTRFTVRKV